MMNKYILIIICSILLFASRLIAQKPLDDVVYLTNGSFLRGKIIEMNPGQSLRIVLQGSDSLTVMMADVKEIKQEETPPAVVVPAEGARKDQGYTLMADANFGLGKLRGPDRVTDDDQAAWSAMFTVFNGFTLSPYVQLGLSTGIELWSTRFFIPVFVDLRVNFMDRDNSPFAYLNGGYSIGWKQGSPGTGYGGGMAAAGLGAKFRISPKNLMLVSLGYMFQQTLLYSPQSSGGSRITIDAHLLNVRIGLMF